ncbi:MFS transporter [Pseudonocardia sp. TRM90224]|uniref:MFS transporter n=1 Tax=Pseudonocardia sp. TRM90224 TaxID=2812678 RepID=UPI001E461065|nr:MFS transporter [Pseudonocardia sp. TRM90224]
MVRIGDSSFRAAIAVGEFRSIWLAELQSVIGDQLARLAVSVLVFHDTGSATWPALAYALTYLPDIVAGPVLGGLADRYPRRTIMIGADALRAAAIGVMALPGIPLAVVAVLLVIAQLAGSPFSAAQAALLPTVLPGELYASGQSIRQITHQAGQLAGFAAGGVVVALLGAHRALAVDAATFAVSAIVVRHGVRHRPAATGTGGPSPWQRVSAGARTIRRDPRLRSLTGLAWLAGFVIVPEGLALPYAAEIGGGATVAGLMLAAHPAGIAAGAFALNRWASPRTRLRLVGPLALFAIVPLLGYAFRPGAVVAIGLLFGSGCCAAYQVTAAATFMRLVPDAERGQAFGLAGSGLIAVQGVGLLAGAGLVSLLGSPAFTVATIAALGTLTAIPAAVAWRRICVAVDA